MYVVLCKQTTAYELRISDWSSDVCSSDLAGTPGSVMTYFPFPHIARGRPGTGEVGTTLFSVPEGSLEFWKDRLARAGAEGLKAASAFGENRLHFTGPDSDGFALGVVTEYLRDPWPCTGVGADERKRVREG